MAVITCIEDLRRIAERRVPRMFYDYADTGSWSETTYRANEADFAGIRFRQRVAIDVAERSVASKMIGIDTASPSSVEARLRFSMLQATRWRNLIARKSSTFARYVLSVQEPESA